MMIEAEKQVLNLHMCAIHSRALLVCYRVYLHICSLTVSALVLKGCFSHVAVRDS
jgi:hypothetical protein